MNFGDYQALGPRRSLFPLIDLHGRAGKPVVCGSWTLNMGVPRELVRLPRFGVLLRAALLSASDV
jgi:hypothetical protein